MATQTNHDQINLHSPNFLLVSKIRKKESNPAPAAPHVSRSRDPPCILIRGWHESSGQSLKSSFCTTKIIVFFLDFFVVVVIFGHILTFFGCWVVLWIFFGFVGIFFGFFWILFLDFSLNFFFWVFFKFTMVTSKS